MIRKRIFKKKIAIIVWLLLTDQNSTKFIILVVPCDKMVPSYSNGQSNGKYWRLLQRPVETEVLTVLQRPVETEVLAVLQRPVETEVLAVLQRPVETEVKGTTTQKDTLYLFIFWRIELKRFYNKYWKKFSKSYQNFNNSAKTFNLPWRNKIIMLHHFSGSSAKQAAISNYTPLLNY